MQSSSTVVEVGPLDRGDIRGGVAIGDGISHGYTECKLAVPSFHANYVDRYRSQALGIAWRY